MPQTDVSEGRLNESKNPQKTALFAHFFIENQGV
jgi:hypothetical protein